MSLLSCQKCRTPLKIDGTLEDLNPASFKILADAAPSLAPKTPEAPRSAAAKERRQQYGEASQQAGAPIHKRRTSAGQKGSERMKPDMSYIMLTESQFGPAGHDEAMQSPTKRGLAPSVAVKAETKSTGNAAITAADLEQTMKLFEILSARSDIDHPICTECTEMLLEGLQKRQAGVTRERDAYVQFLKHAQEDVPTDEEKAKTKADLEDAQRREKQALEELEALEAEKARMEDEIAALDAEAEDLDEEEERFWRERNAFTAELTAYQEERDSLQHQVAHDSKLLESLQRTNVYNDTFCIGHDGNFGTINGLRLGRLPDHPVDWAEINAAWGQVMLLTAIVADKEKCKLDGWKLHPVGSTSKIEKIEGSGQANTGSKSSMFELYSSGDVPMSFGFLHRSFDSGMVAFLDCLRQLGQHVERTSSQTPGSTGLKMPYAINKDKIGDVSIKLGNFGQEEQWTKACKYTLTCCKFLLAHASHVADDAIESKGAR
jgi:beclin 1